MLRRSAVAPMIARIKTPPTIEVSSRSRPSSLSAARAIEVRNVVVSSLTRSASVSRRTSAASFHVSSSSAIRWSVHELGSKQGERAPCARDRKLLERLCALGSCIVRESSERAGGGRVEAGQDNRVAVAESGFQILEQVGLLGFEKRKKCTFTLFSSSQRCAREFGFDRRAECIDEFGVDLSSPGGTGASPTARGR